jgi:hypothetical protein
MRTETSGLDPVCNARDVICRLGYELAPAPSARVEVTGREGAAHGGDHVSAVVFEQHEGVAGLGGGPTKTNRQWGAVAV